MEKSIYTAEYAVVLQLLRELRHSAGISQIDLADRLGQSQSFVSKMERGDRRLDVIQLRSVCVALGSDLLTFANELESRLPKPGRRRKAHEK
ncbi:MAG: helix-turn-helix transcriptional regulator [Planctomycetaceae bacterium]